MIMLIDAVAERYGVLPSKVLYEANTFDIFICNSAIGYRNYLAQKATKMPDNNVEQECDQDELLKILRGEI